MKVFLDTSVLIAAFATRGLCADVLRTVLAEHELIPSEIVLTEFRRALSKKLKVPDQRIHAAEAVFESIPLVPKPKKPSFDQGKRQGGSLDPGERRGRWRGRARNG